jgi:hypothetical protein
MTPTWEQLLLNFTHIVGAVVGIVLALITLGPLNYLSVHDLRLAAFPIGRPLLRLGLILGLLLAATSVSLLLFGAGIRTSDY